MITKEKRERFKKLLSFLEGTSVLVGKDADLRDKYEWKEFNVYSEDEMKQLKKRLKLEGYYVRTRRRVSYLDGSVSWHVGAIKERGV